VIWATRHLPHPGHGGGAVAEFEFLRAASRANEITVVSGAVPRGSSTTIDGADVEVIGVGTPVGTAPSRRRLLAHLLFGSSPLPVWEAEPCAAALADGVAELERQRGADLVQVWPGEMAVVATAARAPSAILLADSYTRQAEREHAVAVRLRHRLLWAVEGRKARRWESRTYRFASALACVSPVDAEELAEMTSRRVDVIPLPVGDEWFVAPDGGRGDDVVFVGALDYRPNVDAVCWLAEDIWPRVRVLMPLARLHVVGRNPTAAVRAAVARVGGALHADVQDARPWYWRAGVVVSPVRLGSGTRNKVLHAFACRSPLVATSASVEGVPCRAGVDLLVADDAESFARAIVATVTDRQGASARAERAVDVASAFRAEMSGLALGRFWERTVGEPRREPLR
jgi:polysaccharide biosynthesis protein PslH